MKILLCSIPDTRLSESTNPILSKTGGSPSSEPWMPTGLLRVDSWIQKHGYNNVRGGSYVNSKTLQKSNLPTCFNCGKKGHYSNQCFYYN